jgi:hypothetical protein
MTPVPVAAADLLTDCCISSAAFAALTDFPIPVDLVVVELHLVNQLVILFWERDLITLITPGSCANAV